LSTTNSLLEKSHKRAILVIDSTYKIFFQGYPIMIAGTIDYQRHFHAICETNEDFELMPYEKKRCRAESEG
jgi:hypothetical protein